MPASKRTGRRAVITGVGVVAPGGIGTKAYWALLADGRSATRTITHFDASPYRSRVAGECDFDPLREGLSPREIRGLDRASQFAVVAAREAVCTSGLEFARLDPRRIGVVLGCAVGGMTRPDPALDAASRGYDYVTPNAIAAELASRVGVLGPVRAVSTGCTSGTDSVGRAAALVTGGSADVVVTGGTEAPLAPVTMVCFDIIRATSTSNDDPAHACRPFDRNRDGVVLAEGAAVLIVEELQHARRRGAHVYAEVTGYATRWDPYYTASLDREGNRLAEAIEAAMRAARIDPSMLDYVNAHGSGSVWDDLRETRAFKRSLGRYAHSTPVSGIKSMIGHSLGAAGSLEIAGCLLAFEEGVIAPTANLHEPDPRCDLDYVPLVAREQRVDTALTVATGFEGIQSALVLQRSAPGATPG